MTTTDSESLIENLFACGCSYPTPAQLEALTEASQMVSEELDVAANGTLSFSLPPLGVGVVRFDGANPYAPLGG